MLARRPRGGAKGTPEHYKGGRTRRPTPVSEHNQQDTAIAIGADVRRYLAQDHDSVGAV
jgi:hypothetical protein